MSTVEAVALKEAGNGLYRAKQYALAVAKYEAAIALEPTYKEALLNAGTCYRHLRQYDQAIPYLIKAIRCDQRYVKAYNQLSLAMEEILQLPNNDGLIALCKRTLAINGLLEQADAANLFFLIVDLKIDTENNVKVLEFGDGMRSGSDIKRVHLGSALRDMLGLPSLFSSEFGSPEVNVSRDDLDTVVEDWRRSPASHNSQYCGVYGGARMQPMGPDVLLMNKHMVSVKLLDEKVHMHELFHRAGMLHYRPVSRVYRTEYTPRLMDDIIQHIPGDVVVVKNSDGVRGMGVLLVPKERLGATLRCILNKDVNALAEMNEADQMACATWMRTSRHEFVVEEYVRSKSVVYSGDRLIYDPALRVVLLMSAIDGVVNNINPLSFYWKFPKTPAAAIPNRDSSVSSFDIYAEELRVGEVSAEDRAVVTSALREFLPPLMTAAFCIGVDETLQSLTALSASPTAAARQKSLMPVVLANGLAHQGQFAHAFYLIYGYLSANPTCLTGRYEAAMVNLLCGNYDKAIEMFKRLHEHSGSNLRIAMAYRMKGDFETAAEWLLKARIHGGPLVVSEAQLIRRECKL